MTACETYDVIVVGGGSSGVAAAVASARAGANTLLIEQNGYLGGTATASLVTPMMPNQSKGVNLTEGLYETVLLDLAQRWGGAQRFSDNNPGWVNPELLKAYLDELCTTAGVTVRYDMTLIGVERHQETISALNCILHGQTVRYQAKRFIDASGNATLSYLANVPMLDDEGHQALSLRFIMGGVNLEQLADWIRQWDPDNKNSAIYRHPNGHYMLSTAHTLDDDSWLLRPVFKEGLSEGLITEAEAAYFQIFTVPGMPGCVSFNCPRIAATTPLDPLDPADVAYAYQTGRQQIQRLVRFCIAKIGGFEAAFLAQMAPQLGVRESRRIRGQYIVSDEDILGCRKFGSQAVAKCAYPIDIHKASPKADKGGLQKLKDGDYYEIPLQALMPEGVGNLLVVGRCISATFLAQSSFRIQAVCWRMGECAGQYSAQQVQHAQQV